MQHEYGDVICELDQAIADENEYNNTAEIKKAKSCIKDLKKKLY